MMQNWNRLSIIHSTHEVQTIKYIDEIRIALQKIAKKDRRQFMGTIRPPKLAFTAAKKTRILVPLQAAKAIIGYRPLSILTIGIMVGWSCTVRLDRRGPLFIANPSDQTRYCFCGQGLQTS